MDILLEKLKLIGWIADLNDPMLIKQLVELKHENETDSWNDLTKIQKTHIEKGLSQAEAGLGKPLGEVYKDLMKKYGLA